MIHDLAQLSLVNVQVLEKTPAHKVHRLFRSMGLRHLVVTSELNEVRGVITRADLIHQHHLLEAERFI